jgi:hypothetical protein
LDLPALFSILLANFREKCGAGQPQAGGTTLNVCLLKK